MMDNLMLLISLIALFLLGLALLRLFTLPFHCRAAAVRQREDDAHEDIRRILDDAVERAEYDGWGFK